MEQMLGEDGNLMNLVILTIAIISEYHWDKNIVNPGKGTWIKGIDKLLNRLLQTVEGVTDPELDSVIEMIKK